jgi:hypothetical protein
MCQQDLIAQQKRPRHNSRPVCSSPRPPARNPRATFPRPQHRSPKNTIAGNTIASDDMPARLDRLTGATPSQLEAGLQQPVPVIAVPQSDASVATSDPTQVVLQTTVLHHTFQHGNAPWRPLGLGIFSQSSKATLRLLPWERASPSTKGSIGLLILVALWVIIWAALAVSGKTGLHKPES